jgi:hypothetical protein
VHDVALALEYVAQSARHSGDTGDAMLQLSTNTICSCKCIARCPTTVGIALQVFGGAILASKCYNACSEPRTPYPEGSSCFCTDRYNVFMPLSARALPSYSSTEGAPLDQTLRH